MLFLSLDFLMSDHLCLSMFRAFMFLHVRDRFCFSGVSDLLLCFSLCGSHSWPCYLETACWTLQTVD